MKKNIVLFIYCAIMLMVSIVPVYSTNYSSPILPGIKERDKFMGIMLGFGQNVQKGTQYVECDTCNFENGVAFGYSFGLTYEKKLSINESDFLYHINVGGLLHLSNRNVNSSFTEQIGVYFPDYNLQMPLTYKHISNATIMNVGIMPYIHYFPIKYLYFGLGLDASFILNHSIKHQVDLLTKRKTLPNGEVVDVFFPVTNNPDKKQYSRVLQDSPIRDINIFQIALSPSIGGNIYISDKFIFSPNIMYFVPLNNISSFGNSFSISAWRANIEFKYNLNTPPKSAPNPVPVVNRRKKI